MMDEANDIGSETVLVTVRMPSWMRDWLKQSCKDGDRTLSAQVVRELRLARERQTAESDGPQE